MHHPVLGPPRALAGLLSGGAGRDVGGVRGSGGTSRPDGGDGAGGVSRVSRAKGVEGAGVVGGLDDVVEVVVRGVLAGVAQHLLQGAEQSQPEGGIDAAGVDRAPDLVGGQGLLGGAQVVADRGDQVGLQARVGHGVGAGPWRLGALGAQEGEVP